METLKVFVSSTSLDLLAERKAVAAVLRKSELTVTAMEDWDALPSDAVTVSLHGVSNCDVFIGIYAFRYGFIPPGDTSSITEQEYELARREGKRCLCYFKDEATEAPVINDPDLVEPAAHINRLTAFKQRIEKELVRGQYTSPGDLAATLAVDLARLEKGYLPGYSRRDLCKRWADRGIEMRNQLVRGSLSGHTNILPSPVLRSWSSFIKEKAWHEVVQRDLKGITELAKDLDRLSELRRRTTELASRIERGDQTGRLLNYHTILTELDKTITNTDISTAEVLLAEFRNQVDAAHESTNHPYPFAEEKLQQTKSLLREMRIMKESRKQHSFRKCFPIVGSLGSGRTHFVTSLLGSTPYSSATQPLQTDDDWCENHDFLVLLLDQTSTKSLEETILDGINRASGLQWRSLDEFDRFLSGRSVEKDSVPKIRLCIAIDDLQRWLLNRSKITNGLDELTQFIEAHTYLSSFFWIFTLQDTSYSQVSGLNSLLRHYSYFQTDIQPQVARDFGNPPETQETKDSHFSGWLALDDLNRTEEFGLKLIEAGLRRVNASLPAPDLLRQNAAVLRNLIKPFVACVLLDMHSQGRIDLQRLATLSYMNFVSEFWEKRKNEFINEYDRLRSDDFKGINYDDSSQALKLVAETLSQTGEFNPLQKDLEALVVDAASKEGHSKPEQMVAAALSSLTKSGFLKRFVSADPQMPKYEVQRIGFEFEPFWEERLADHIRNWRSFRRLNETAAQDQLLKWFGVVESSEIEEGVLEFLLLLLDGEVGKDERKRGFVSFLQQLAIGSAELPEEAVWFSGVNATVQSQVFLMDLVEQRNKKLTSQRLLHSVMYFLVECLPQVSQSANRFRLLQPYYRDISREGLSAYFLYIAGRLLPQAHDHKAVRRSMRYLGQSEVMGIQQALGSLTVDVLFGKAEEEFGELNEACFESLIRTVINYLKDSLEEADNDYKRRGPIKRWERFFYREWVLRFFCSRLVYETGIDAYGLLARLGWYEPHKLGIPWPISVEIHREANLALGDWYRIRRFGKRAELYLKLIQDLVNSDDFRERETAFHLIRHSEATHGEKGLVVEEVFVPMLEKIFLDPELSKTVFRFYELFRMNLSDFRKLDSIRKKKLDQKNNDSAGRPSNRRKPQRKKRPRR